MNACALGVFFFLISLKRTIPYRARAVVYITTGRLPMPTEDITTEPALFLCSFIIEVAGLSPVIVNH